jgi:hypothetical protein
MDGSAHGQSINLSGAMWQSLLCLHSTFRRSISTVGTLWGAMPCPQAWQVCPDGSGLGTKQQSCAGAHLEGMLPKEDELNLFQLPWCELWASIDTATRLWPLPCEHMFAQLRDVPTFTRQACGILKALRYVAVAELSQGLLEKPDVCHPVNQAIFVQELWTLHEVPRSIGAGHVSTFRTCSLTRRPRVGIRPSASKKLRCWGHL